MLRTLVILLALTGTAAAQAPSVGGHGQPPHPPAGGPDDAGRAPIREADGAHGRPPLRHLLLVSPIACVGRIERSEPADADQPARLVVRPARVLQGQVGSILVQAWAPRGALPAPGATGVFFLSRGDRDPPAGPLRVDAFLPAAGRTLAVFEHRIDELVDILAERSAGRRDVRTAEWLVQLVEEPATRWDGVADLASLDDPRALGRRGGRPQFDTPQRARLLAVLLAQRTLSAETTGLAAVLPHDDDARVERWLWERLNESPELPMPVTGDAMRLLARRLDDRDAERLADALPAGGAREARRAVVAGFLERLEPRVFRAAPGRHDG